jgi:hypothetical protein
MNEIDGRITCSSISSSFVYSLVDPEDDESGTRDCLLGDACRASGGRGRMLFLLHSFCLPAILVSLV